MNLPPPRVCPCGSEVLPYGVKCSCAIERKAASDKARKAPSQRGYDRAWQRLRKSFLLAFPVCSTDGCGKPSTDADHIISINENPALRLVWSNLRPFCHPCHSRHTARTQGFARKGGV